MSVSAAPSTPQGPATTRAWKRLGLSLAAIALVAGVLGLLAWWLAPEAAPPQRNPFGMGLREATPTGGIGAYILAVQSAFYKSLQQAVSGLRAEGGALWPLLALGFAYGIFHAAGPGHGKGVIAAYIVADEKALAKGLGLSLAAALMQALVAILVVGIVALLFKATAATMNRVAESVEMFSFAAVAVLGAFVTWRKAGKVLGVAALARDPLQAPQAETCDHVHLPPPEELRRLTRWRDMAGVVFAAGLRPCSGALIVLVFALAQGLFAAGIAATFAMALGTALTTGAIAAFAVFAKAIALRAAGGRGARGAIAVAWIELLAAAFVLVLGASLLGGLWSQNF